jgi:UPF0755 protein
MHEGMSQGHLADEHESAPDSEGAGGGRRRIAPKSPKQAIQPDTPPPPPARSRGAKHPLVVVLNFFMMFTVLAVLAVGAAVYFGKARFTAVGPLGEPRTVMIARGSDLETIAALLKRHGVIDSDLLFSVGVRLYGAGGDLKAGEYLFEPRASMHQVMTALVSGRSLLHTVTIPEGLTSRQIVERLLEHEMLTGDIEAIPEEGSLLPDTYRVTRGTPRQQILDQMRRARDRIVQDIWERRSPDLPIDSVDEFVTLASIVEKETGRADERPRVASVFINRLKRNMRLQSDPTIIYGLFGGQGKPPDRPIFRSDIDSLTPYNTYQISGLPPGPIANPGRAALEAVANPSRTDDLYFVADGTGGHVFAGTLDEHNRNVARWRQIERERQESAGIEEASAEVGADPGTGAGVALAADSATASAEGGEAGAATSEATVGNPATPLPRPRPAVGNAGAAR